MTLWRLCRAAARLLERLGLSATHEERELARIDREEDR